MKRPLIHGHSTASNIARRKYKRTIVLNISGILYFDLNGQKILIGVFVGKTENDSLNTVFDLSWLPQIFRILK